MSYVPASEIRAFMLNRLAAPLSARRLTPQDVPDDFDLLTEGVIDSFGIVELVAAVEEQFGVALDLEELDADDLTVVGPLCRYIEAQSGALEKLRA